MKRTFTKLCFACLFGFVITAFTGCDSPINPAGGINEMITGNVYSEEDSTPVKGIKVTSNYGYTLTDENGYFEILSYYLVDKTSDSSISVPKEDHVLTFTDIDGDANGKFKETTVNVTPKSKKTITVQIEKDL